VTKSLSLRALRHPKPLHYSYIDNLSGPAGGVGVEFRYGRIKFDPEVRYAHLDSRINLVTVLLGVTF
jgi:hypothetical protein